MSATRTAEKIIDHFGFSTALDERYIVEIMPQNFVATESGVQWLEKNGKNIE